MSTRARTVQYSLVVEVKTHGVTNEVLGARLETELRVDSLHRVLVQVNA